ncbi:uncharacterized protein [Anabrus simplex]|uniref:uncharacterized protein isoform X3 n=1 Tax=Anabrus simplex TaxID=316456 RepID=UPI0035A3D09C
MSVVMNFSIVFRNNEMVKLRVAVLIIGMILSPVKPMPPPPFNCRLYDVFCGQTIVLEETTPTTRPPPVIDNCVFYRRADNIIHLPFLRLHAMEKNWSQAKSTCEREGGHLASPRTGQELELYMDYVSSIRYGVTGYWIGVSRDSVSDPWMTVQGTTRWWNFG